MKKAKLVLCRATVNMAGAPHGAEVLVPVEEEWAQQMMYPPAGTDPLLVPLDGRDYRQEAPEAPAEAPLHEASPGTPDALLGALSAPQPPSGS